MGWGHGGKGYWHHGHHHHHHGHGFGKAVAEAAVLGSAAIAGAAVVSAVANRAPPPPRREVVVVPAVTPVATAPVAATTPVVVVEGKGKGWKGKGKGKTEVIEVPPLGVSAVGIPASAVSKQGGVTFFGVDVVPETGGSYRVQKRYNDFEKLKDRSSGETGMESIERSQWFHVVSICNARWSVCVTIDNVQLLFGIFAFAADIKPVQKS